MPLTIKEITKTLEEHETCCLDNKRERNKIARALAKKRLTKYSPLPKGQDPNHHPTQDMMNWIDEMIRLEGGRASVRGSIAKALAGRCEEIATRMVKLWPELTVIRGMVILRGAEMDSWRDRYPCHTWMVINNGNGDVIIDPSVVQFGDRFMGYVPAERFTSEEWLEENL